MRRMFLSLFCLPLLVLTFGCAQKIVKEPMPLNSPETLVAENENTESSSVTASDSDSEFSDDDLFDEGDDLLDEEFQETEKKPAAAISDPLEPWNRAMHTFNDKLYFWLMKPLAEGFKVAVPQPIRTGIRNFFGNITTPVRLANCILQGKSEKAADEIGRFLVNSTIGFLGFGDPAKSRFHIDPGDEDLGQTLAFYGIGDGIYIVWPVLGPSTLRDSCGTAGDYFLDPMNYADLSTMEAMEVTMVQKVNAASFRVGDYEALKKAAFDPYDAFRNFYIQYRKKKISE